ncbi:hypothetical protein N2152v2_002213 [Parachlorella kessleri]
MQLAASSLSSRHCLVQRPFVAVKPAGRPALRPMAVCPVAKATKASELRSLSKEDIERQVEEGKRELFSLRIKYAKREIAQLLTIKRERELAEGMTRRDARGKELLLGLAISEVELRQGAELFGWPATPAAA